MPDFLLKSLYFGTDFKADFAAENKPSVKKRRKKPKHYTHLPWESIFPWYPANVCLLASIDDMFTHVPAAACEYSSYFILNVYLDLWILLQNPQHKQNLLQKDLIVDFQCGKSATNPCSLHSRNWHGGDLKICTAV